MERKFEEELDISWDQLAKDLTEHMLRGRCQWAWKSLEDPHNEPHVITCNSRQGNALAVATVKHVKQKKDFIRQQVDQTLHERELEREEA